MCRAHSHLRIVLLLILLLTVGNSSRAADQPKQHWILVSSSHFSVLTDADEKKANEVLLRFEQMRVVFGQLLERTKLVMPEPLDIIGLNTRAEYAQVAPVRQGQPIATSGFFLPEHDDRNFVGLDLSDTQSWRAISRQMARVYLNYNYPPTQPWFDEGFVEYASSLQLNTQEAQIGGDPAALLPTLASQSWIPVAELFKLGGDSAKPGTSSPMFRAESWMVMHYLLRHSKLPETGAYFGLVENRHVPVEQAIQQAYGMTAAQFDSSVKNYFHAVESSPENRAGSATASTQPTLVDHFPLPLTPLDVGTSVRRLEIPEGQARVAELAARTPEHRDQAVKDLQNLIAQPKGETSIADRTLAWVFLEQRDYGEASQELANASDRDHSDPWVHYYLALAKYKQASESGKPTQGLPNMMQDLHAVLDWNPNFAKAYDMLAMAQLEGGGIHAAADTIRLAIQLGPRNETYLLHLAQIHLEGKQWDNATALLNRLQTSRDSKIAGVAKQDLADLPTLKKYGIPPQRKADDNLPATIVISNNTDDDLNDDDAPPTPAPGPDMRKTQFLQGKLLNVDCSQPPVALLRVLRGAKVLKLRSADYKTLVLIGADSFSCDWKDVTIVANYKAGGNADGDLISLELR